ncbi:hypothetical protein FAUST_5276 [Fusarium austroamericanum]|uniref:Uncharacterized protein n=1 Tax=Fusarium austroamericanum TaxID=282268 RepID=A0AAN6C1E7_FUSAU|nr:hypothetical protein FAUST_5276 [Fusarium austroamericanum]
MSLQQSNNQSRPVHTCILAMLPAEVIYEVIDAFRRNPYDPDDPRAGLDSLDQTSPHLRSFSLVRPVFFRASNFKQLFQSLRVANATMMDRYADEWHHDSKRSYRTSSPLSIALKSHVTPSILELMLSEHADRGIKLTDWYDECPTSLVKLATQEDTRGVSVNWTEVSYVDRLIGILHADLHKKWTGWEEEYFGEAADIFQAKLKLMIKYEMIDTSEEALLKSIGSALYSIAADGMQAGGYGQEHIKRSWEKLCDAVKPFATDANLVEDPNGIQLPNAPRRIHRFAIHPEWNPWESWFRRQDEIRREEWEDMWFWHATTKLFKPMQYDRASSLGVPEWHTVSMDEWDAFFPRPE